MPATTATLGHRPVPRTLLRTSDGDTPVVDQPVRLVSVDTPEKAGFAGKAATAQAKLDACRARLEDGTYDRLPKEFRDYLLGRLTPDAAERHIAAGSRASQQFDAFLADRLTRDDGRQRKVAVLAAGELLDRYGRLLAYTAPWFGGGADDPLPPKTDPRRRTFNLQMVEAGWGALFLVYPSLPQDSKDYRLAVAAAESAWTARRGMWAEFGEDLLLGYEYRALIRLGTIADPSDALAQAYTRICFDLRDGTDLGLYGYPSVPPSARLFVWQDQHALALPALAALPELPVTALRAVPTARASSDGRLTEGRS